MSSLGPTIIFDKSLLQSLSEDESIWLDAFYHTILTPLFYVETLADLSKESETRSPEDTVRMIASRWYMELFENAIYEGNKKLLVIGYGFRDDHINDILLKGVQEHGLSLYVINPTDPEAFKNILEGRPTHSGSWEVSKYFPIWKGVKGYFPYSLREIYPPDQSVTTMATEIKRSLDG